jgi:thioredoxin 1
MSVVEITDKDHFVKILTQNDIVVVDIYGNWCGPCKTIAPRYEKLSEKYDQVTFTKENTDLDNQYHEDVSAVPTFVIYVEGKEVDRVLGADIKLLEEKISNNVDSFTPITYGTPIE